jgi:lysophospholipase L1-like esterase
LKAAKGMNRSHKSRRIVRLAACSVILFTCLLAFSQAGQVYTQPSGQFALKDGETVVFYGDSITAQRLYTRFVEEFVLTRYPDLHVKFVNAGVPGDQVSGGYAGKMPERVKRDVQPFHPDMITVMLGMNDGWWGTESPEVDAFFKKGYGELLDTLHQAAPDAAMTLIRPSPYDEITHGTEFPQYSRVIDDLANDVSTIAAEKKASGNRSIHIADFHQPLIEALQRAKAQSPVLAALIVPDRIHPAEVGHWIMAAQLLSTWNVDPIVSSVTLNAGSTTLNASIIDRQRTTITALSSTSTGIQWTQQDDDLPLPFDFNNVLIQLLPSISEIAKMDQQIVKAEALEPGSYQLLIDGKIRGTFSAAELQSGVNLALMKTPMVDQARDIDYIENQRMQLDQARFVLSADVKTNPPSTLAQDQLSHAEDMLATEIRKQLKPNPHKFELRRQ